jgi:hypothetical protein
MTTPTTGGVGRAPPSRRPRVLLAVTGSVAAVKGPEIAVRLVREAGADVRVLLSRGGENFWTKAGAYDGKYWAALRGLLLIDPSSNTGTTDQDDDVEEEERRIAIYGEEQKVLD